MLIIGCDFHPGFQQVAIFDKRTGEVQEKRLQHRAETEEFYRSLAGQEVRVGMEACGHYPWFERLLAELAWSCGWENDANDRWDSKTGQARIPFLTISYLGLLLLIESHALWLFYHTQDL